MSKKSAGREVTVKKRDLIAMVNQANELVPREDIGGMGVLRLAEFLGLAEQAAMAASKAVSAEKRKLLRATDGMKGSPIIDAAERHDEVVDKILDEEFTFTMIPLNASELQIETEDGVETFAGGAATLHYLRPILNMDIKE